MIKFKHNMDATPSFGVTMISEVPSNPQLTLVEFAGKYKKDLDQDISSAEGF